MMTNWIFLLYATAINGTSSMSDDPADQRALWHRFDTIIDHIPAPVDEFRRATSIPSFSFGLQ